ncbi:hypothetical protein BDV23DRAFT_184139 [Aspergillus alliaceus]|uniref:Aminotransferase class V domain-containing protein n=1 Tax=Petromyces alliaceus TaxID=209559 RepID=A0A5N7C6J8_PETAA|nr:hypothetical protein BDV23DRAFT_184139 [Aspergillus alliaceus]
MENKKTRLIAVSYVSYLNSPQVNLSHYPQLASLVRAILIVDFTQAAGYAPIDASVADSAFLACYKWLLGTTAAAITYWNQTRMPDSSPATGGLQREDIPSSAPVDKARHGASVTIDCVGASEIVDEMRKDDVYAWNSQDRVRISFHGYNCVQMSIGSWKSFRLSWSLEEV